nr:aminotransferase class V-fold PLP-dependent enzyme [bacterium]
HERGLRSGTLNVPGVIGLGKACEICAVEMQTEATRIAKLRKQLLDGILSNMEGVTINGTMENRLDGNLNLTFYGVDSETLILSMKEIAVSSGSACTSATIEPSHVLKALGLSNLQARSSLRLSIGRMTTADEIDFVTQQIENAVNRLRHRKH